MTVGKPMLSEELHPQHDFETVVREQIEARNLAIKTDNLVKNLSADIKQIARQQEAYQRRYLFNSGVAYVLFVVIIFGGLYLAFNAKLSSFISDAEHYRERNELLEVRLSDVQLELDERRESENRAYEFFQLLESGNTEIVVSEFTQVQTQITNRAILALFRERVETISHGLAEAAFREGMTHIQAESWSAARDSFLASANHEEQTSWSPELHYNLGRSLFHLEDFEGALHYFELALARQELDDSQRANALYNRALCLESTGRLSEADSGFRDFRDRYPANRQAGRALRHINGIQREINRAAD